MLPPPSDNYTKLHNDYIDSFMYLMTPYEVVVFLFVLRHTHGYQRSSAKFSYSVIRDGFFIDREDDALAQRYGTGLSYSTIKKALDGLVEYGFLIRGRVSKAGTQYAIGDTIKFDALVNRHNDKTNKNRKKLRHAINAQDDPIEETAFVIGRLPDAREKNNTAAMDDDLPQWMDAGFRVPDDDTQDDETM